MYYYYLENSRFITCNINVFNCVLEISRQFEEFIKKDTRSLYFHTRLNRFLKKLEKRYKLKLEFKKQMESSVYKKRKFSFTHHLELVYNVKLTRTTRYVYSLVFKTIKYRAFVRIAKREKIDPYVFAHHNFEYMFL